MIEQIKIGNIIKFGAYNKGSIEQKVKEPLEWEVKDIIENKALLVTKDIIDCAVFDFSRDVSIWGNPKWEDSTIRKWLNVDFYIEVFTDSEKEVIVDNYLEDTGTLDTIFLLSEQEVKKYYRNDKDRIKQGTKYAKEYGLYDWNNNGNADWWLRTPCEEDVCVINSDGSISSCSPSCDFVGLVCALLIDLSKIK